MRFVLVILLSCFAFGLVPVSLLAQRAPESTTIETDFGIFRLILERPKSAIGRLEPPVVGEVHYSPKETPFLSYRVPAETDVLELVGNRKGVAILTSDRHVLVWDSSRLDYKFPHEAGTKPIRPGGWIDLSPLIRVPDIASLTVLSGALYYGRAGDQVKILDKLTNEPGYHMGDITKNQYAILHEIGHAYIAELLGIKVKEMGFIYHHSNFKELSKIREGWVRLEEDSERLEKIADLIRIAVAGSVADYYFASPFYQGLSGHHSDPAYAVDREFIFNLFRRLMEEYTHMGAAHKMDTERMGMIISEAAAFVLSVFKKSHNDIIRLAQKYYLNLIANGQTRHPEKIRIRFASESKRKEILGVGRKAEIKVARKGVSPDQYALTEGVYPDEWIEHTWNPDEHKRPGSAPPKTDGDRGNTLGFYLFGEKFITKDGNFDTAAAQRAASSVPASLDAALDTPNPNDEKWILFKYLQEHYTEFMSSHHAFIGAGGTGDTFSAWRGGVPSFAASVFFAEAIYTLLQGETGYERFQLALDKLFADPTGEGVSMVSSYLSFILGFTYGEAFYARIVSASGQAKLKPRTLSGALWGYTMAEFASALVAEGYLESRATDSSIFTAMFMLINDPKYLAQMGISYSSFTTSYGTVQFLKNFLKLPIFKSNLVSMVATLVLTNFLIDYSYGFYAGWEAEKTTFEDLVGAIDDFKTGFYYSTSEIRMPVVIWALTNMRNYFQRMRQYQLQPLTEFMNEYKKDVENSYSSIVDVAYPSVDEFGGRYKIVEEDGKTYYVSDLDGRKKLIPQEELDTAYAAAERLAFNQSELDGVLAETTKKPSFFKSPEEVEKFIIERYKNRTKRETPRYSEFIFELKLYLGEKPGELAYSDFNLIEFVILSLTLKELEHDLTTSIELADIERTKEKNELLRGTLSAKQTEGGRLGPAPESFPIVTPTEEEISDKEKIKEEFALAFEKRKRADGTPIIIPADKRCPDGSSTPCKKCPDGTDPPCEEEPEPPTLERRKKPDKDPGTGGAISPRSPAEIEISRREKPETSFKPEKPTEITTLMKSESFLEEGTPVTISGIHDEETVYGWDITGDKIPDSAVETGLVTIGGAEVMSYDCAGTFTPNCVREEITTGEKRSFVYWSIAETKIYGTYRIEKAIAVDLNSDTIFDFEETEEKPKLKTAPLDTQKLR